MDTENPPITSLLRFVGILEVLALAAAGIGLFFVYSVAAPLWPWDIKPFNAGFVGATYLGSLMAGVVILGFIPPPPPHRRVSVVHSVSPSRPSPSRSDPHRVASSSDGCPC